MAQVSGVRATYQSVTESRNVRFVKESGLLLEPNEQPLITFLMKAAKDRGGMESTYSPKIEWPEDDYVARWAANGSATVAASTASTTVTVTDGTLFTVGDLFCHPNAASSATAPEICRVSAVSTNTLTVSRGFAGTTAQAINPSAAICILGTAYAEGAAVSVAKTTVPSMKTSYVEIFKKSTNLTNTAIASKTYGAPEGERARLHRKLLKQMKIDMNRSFLWGKASETISSNSNTIRTSMGLNTVISTNTTSASGTLTEAIFETFARQSFRYGSDTKLLLASPIVISAIHSWGNADLQMRPGGKMWGVNVTEVWTGHGKWLLARDWMLENGGAAGTNGFSGWAFSIDPEEIEPYVLKGNGVDRSLQIHENVVRDGADRIVDEALCECGIAIRHEKKFAKLYNAVAYS